MPRKTDKRNRLIDAAKRLIHQQGFNLTTLADIAQEADVPLGNVYYYFKTKLEIGMAVIEKISSEWFEKLSRWTEHQNPADRLRELIKSSLDSLDSIARYGCPIGGLCQELSKQGGSLANHAANLLNELLNWSEEQFKGLGFRENARSNALELISRMQGMYLLTHTFKDPKLSEMQVNSLISWLDSKTSEVGAPAATVSVPSPTEELIMTEEEIF